MKLIIVDIYFCVRQNKGFSTLDAQSLLNIIFLVTFPYYYMPLYFILYYNI